MEMECDRFPSWWWHSIFAGSLYCLREPSFFGPTTILEYQVVGVPTGTASIMPSATSLSMSCFTLFLCLLTKLQIVTPLTQTANETWCNRLLCLTSYGVWTVVSVALETKVVSNGLPAIACNGWCGHILNALDLKCSFIHCTSWFPLVKMGWDPEGNDVLCRDPNGAILFVSIDEFLYDAGDWKIKG